MNTATQSLSSVFEGWDSHQLALVRAISGLTPEQIAYRPAPNLRSAGEIISHIALGRVDWFHRMGAPGSGALARQLLPSEGEKADTEHLAALRQWMDAIHHQEAAITTNPAELLRWLEASWQMIEQTLATWTVADLGQTFRHFYKGPTYAVSRQWVLWRVMSHDLHHGGELAILLGLQGIEIPDLGDQGGHLTELPLAEPPASA
jgi:uncharacterized damage-inducible protein DinB